MKGHIHQGSDPKNNCHSAVSPDHEEDWQQQFESLFASDFYDLNVDGFSANYIADDASDCDENDELNINFLVPSDDKCEEDSTASNQQQQYSSSPNSSFFNTAVKNENNEVCHSEKLSSADDCSSLDTCHKRGESAPSCSSKTPKSKATKHSRKNTNNGSQKKKKETCIRTVVTETIFNGSIADIVKTRKRGVQVPIDSEVLQGLKNEILTLDGIIPSPKSGHSDLDYDFLESQPLKIIAPNSSNTPKNIKSSCDATDAENNIRSSSNSHSDSRYLLKAKRKASSVKKKKKKQENIESSEIRNAKNWQDSTVPKLDRHGKESPEYKSAIHETFDIGTNGLLDIKSCSSVIKLTDEVKQQVQKLFSPVVSVEDISKNLPSKLQGKSSPAPAKKKLKGIEEYKAHKAKFRKEITNLQQSQESLFANNSASSSPKVLPSDLSFDETKMKSECVSPSWPNLAAHCSAQSSPAAMELKETEPSPILMCDIEIKQECPDIFEGQSMDSELTSSQFSLIDCSKTGQEFIMNGHDLISDEESSEHITNINFSIPVASEIQSRITFNCSTESPPKTALSSPLCTKVKTEPMDETASQIVSDMVLVSQESPRSYTPPLPMIRQAEIVSVNDYVDASCSSKDLPAQYCLLPDADTNNQPSTTPTEKNKSLSTTESGYDSEKNANKPKRSNRVSVSSSSGSSDYSKYSCRRRRASRSPSCERPLPYRRRSGSFDKAKRNKSPHRRNRSRSPLSLSRFRKRREQSGSKYQRSSSRSSYDDSDSEYGRPARYSRVSESPESRTDKRYVTDQRYSYKRSHRMSRSSSESSRSSSASRYSRSPQRKRTKSRRRTISRSPDSSYPRRYRRRSVSRNRSFSPRRNHTLRSSYPSSTRRRWDEQQRQIDERRVVYVGSIPDGYTTAELRARFSCFGDIEDVRIHLRNTRRNDNFGFVTYHDKKDAYKAVEGGNNSKLEPIFDISFGGRRRFCKQRYADLDKENEVKEKYTAPEPPPPPPGEINFDALLRAELKRVKSLRK